MSEIGKGLASRSCTDGRSESHSRLRVELPAAALARQTWLSLGGAGALFGTDHEAFGW
jgi:hypothetical protein